MRDDRAKLAGKLDFRKPQTRDDSSEEERLTSLADAVARGVDVNWNDVAAENFGAESRAVIEELRALAELRQANVKSASAGSSSFDLPTPAESNTWGPLEIIREIGRGTFGTVFLAWDPRLDREVALKVLDETRGTDSIDQAAAVAIDEGKHLARVKHANVVSVYSAGRFKGKLGVCMEFVKGLTLQQIVEAQGAFGAHEAVLIGVQLCGALAAIHHKGLLHCDVKAQNVIREVGGRIVLMDFGAAALLTSNQHSSRRTRGTPSYLAPEVLEGGVPTVSSDLYSLGVLFYYLVTGDYPVTANSLAGLRDAHASHRRRLLRDVRPDLPSSFVRIVDEVIARDPENRPQSAGAIESMLQKATGRAVQRGPAAPLAQSVAVLPFVDMSPTKSLEYFCDGIAEEVINILTPVPGVRVIARGQAFQFKNKPCDLEQIAATLDVGTVLEGSVRAAGDQLRIMATLVDATSGYQLWSQRFDRSLDDTFAVQDEIAAAVVSAVGAQARRRSARGEAYNFYLQGRHFWNKRTESSLHRSAVCFRKAIEKDPGYAEAHAGLAEAYATLGLYGALAPGDVMPKAQEEAQKAIDLTGTLSGPIVTMACIKGVYEWAWADAEREFQRALELNPRHPDAYHWYAINYLVPLGRFDEASQMLKDAADADPLSTPIRVSCGLLRYFSRQYVEALKELRYSLELDPDSATSQMFIGLTLAELGRFDEALPELEEADGRAASPEMTAAIGYVHARAGRHDEARRALDTLLARSRERYVSASLMAQVHAGLGETARALDYLTQASEERAADLAWLRVRPVFDTLRKEGRLVSLIAQVFHQPA
jgi:serine/threonine-protein kinase